MMDAIEFIKERNRMCKSFYDPEHGSCGDCPAKWDDVPNKLPLYQRKGRNKPNFAFLHKSAWKNIPQLAWHHEPTTDAQDAARSMHHSLHHAIASLMRW